MLGARVIKKFSMNAWSPRPMTLVAGDRAVSSSDKVLPLLVARAATDPGAAKLLELFARTGEFRVSILTERIGEVEIPRS
jgi:hypothetical protein